MQNLTPDIVTRRYERAKTRRSAWEAHWRDCYAYAMPQRDGALTKEAPGSKKTDKLFDSTAPDAVENLAASLMAELTPPYARWFDLVPGSDLSPEEAEKIGKPLEELSALMQGHFDASNFAVEIHQCFLDLVTVGTACLMFEEAPLGERSAFRFTAVPLGEVVLEEGGKGTLDHTFREVTLSEEQIHSRFPNAVLSEDLGFEDADEGEARYTILEAVVPERDQGFRYLAMIKSDQANAVEGDVLAQGTYAASPFINFRWMKAPGETYGRSPVMKTLPDIKTANKVVELVLKNATIAVTGIWQADDDGVLNPATVKLAPGTIIPKAVGSAGLTPLKAPGEFDVSQLVLEDVRSRIRHGLMADKLGTIDSPRMTATEVLERSAESTRALGATYGRLQSELMMPLARRALSILRRRAEIPPLMVDGREVELKVVSPITHYRKQAETQKAMQWVEMLAGLGPEALQVINAEEAARWLAKKLDVPENLIRNTGDMPAAQGAMGALSEGMSALGLDGQEALGNLNLEGLNLDNLNLEGLDLEALGLTGAGKSAPTQAPDTPLLQKTNQQPGPHTAKRGLS